MLPAVKVISAFDRLTRPERVNVLILDDSVIKRNRSKKAELLARVYDHVEHKFQKGFTLLTLGWSDGYSFIPTGFNLLSSASESNRYNEVSDPSRKFIAETITLREYLFMLKNSRKISTKNRCMA